MGVNRGKQFETLIRASLKDLPGVSCYRLYDTMGGFVGINNICDFIVYKYPYQFFVECKAIHGNLLNFKSHIRENQLLGLTNQTKIYGVLGVFVIWFIEHDITLIVPVSAVNMLILDGKKSIKYTDKFLTLAGEKKKTLFKYSGLDFVQKLKNLVEAKNENKL